MGTKATKNPFRPTGEEAMSYFVGADNFPGLDKFKGEDAGFAINGGKGWKNVVFSNHQIDLNGDTAIAMGSYDFTCATTGDVATVSTPSVTAAARTANRASCSTTRRCRSRPARPQPLRRRRQRLLRRQRRRR